MSVQINNITDVPCMLYNPEFGNEQIAIDKDGKADKCPRGFYDTMDNQLYALIN